MRNRELLVPEPHGVIKGAGRHVDLVGESVCSNVSCVGVVRLTYRHHRSSNQDGAITLPWSPVDPCHISPREMRSHPIGTGPFKFDEFEPNRSIKITRNPHYWKKDRPKALLGRCRSR